jgi:uncharacterized membrane protein YqgA involved in biofilm formation
MVGIGTLINVVTVLVGGTLGTFLGGRLPERMRETIMHGLGLMTLVIGIQLSFETDNILIVLASLLLGGIAGEWLRIEDRLDQLGRWLERKTAGNKGRSTTDLPPGGAERASPRSARASSGSARASSGSARTSSRFSRAFLTASLVFCVGPMTILGSIQDGLTGDYTLLAVKATLDGFAGLAFASSLGPGVIFAALTVLIYQGALTLGAGWASVLLTDPMIAEMTATGGVLMLALGLGLLEIKQIRAGNLLPAVVVAPIIVAMVK